MSKKSKKSQKKPNRSVAKTLEMAFALFKGGRRWIAGALATTKLTKQQKQEVEDGDRSVEDFEVSVNSPEAYEFCSLGAMKRVDGKNERLAIELLALCFRAEEDEGTVVQTEAGHFMVDCDGLKHSDEDYIIVNNDNGDFKVVQRAFKRAIKIAKKFKR